MKSTILSSPATKSLLNQCIHCGLCLPACPTYAIYHTEMENPRGRILLMRAAAEGRIETDGAFKEHIDLCLGCRACETACPSGVQYGSLLEIARGDMESARVEKGERSTLESLSRWLGLRVLLLKPARLRSLARLLRLYQQLGLSKLTRQLGFLPQSLKDMEELLPPITRNGSNYQRPAPAKTEERGTVAFLHGCVQEAFLSNVNQATVEVLQRNGYRVIFPKPQSCCGAAPLHIGESELAREMARRNIDALGNKIESVDAIISNAGGCGATLKDYAHLLADDPTYAEQAERFAQKVQDISEFLAERLHVPPTRALTKRVTYVDSCHLRHGQKVVQQPRQLLGAIPGVELIELERPDMCCGSAGVYNILQPSTAEQVLEAKMSDVGAKLPDLIVTTNIGCQVQMIYGTRKSGIEAPVMHLVELLALAYKE
ncbi:MAG: heterodisulfide reductase-related iron-sulfur binding cluster [Chloroflexota bacterium]